MFNKFKRLFKKNVPTIKFATKHFELNQKQYCLMQAQSVDAAAAFQLQNRIYQNQTPWLLSNFEREINKHKNRLYLVLCHDAQVIGLIGAWFKPQEAHITNLLIDPAFQNLGLGSYLLSEMIEQARQKSVPILTLEVNVTNQKALALYEKKQFYVAKRVSNYYISTHQDAYHMCLDLERD